MKTILVTFTLLLLVGCGSSQLPPLQVEYEIQSLAVYNQQVKESTVRRDLSDFQLLEFDITDTPYCNLYAYVITQGVISVPYEKTINAVSTTFTEIEETNTEGIYNAILNKEVVKLKPSGKYIPVLDDLSTQAETVPMPDIFIKSILKEIGI